MSDRQAMILELRRVVQPHLRTEKFTGSFPHFRRIGKDAIDLITFQFDKWGGGFVIEIARCPTDGIVTSWGALVPPNKTKAWDVHPDFRRRIQPQIGSGPEEWFRFDVNPLPKVAAEVLDCLTRDDLWADVRIATCKEFRGHNT